MSEKSIMNLIEEQKDTPISTGESVLYKIDTNKGSFVVKKIEYV